jgi:hypothetical protein
LVPMGGGRMWGEGVGRRMNIIQILCTHVCKWKSKTG